MKKFIAALMLCLPLVATPVEIVDPSSLATLGIGTTSFLVPAGATRFACGLAGLAASLTTCAAGIAGKSYYITDIVVGTTTGTSGTYAIQTGTDNNCGTGTAVVFPASPATTSSRFQAPIAANPVAVINFTTPIKLPAAGYLCVIGVATNTININVHGYYY